ncbi:hypothetical protein LTR42_008149 [Elasticomyces elasticus]|nr:hypothetical protein LTR42_008149 [Elasticomyces elasticus]
MANTVHSLEESNREINSTNRPTTLGKPCPGQSNTFPYPSGLRLPNSYEQEGRGNLTAGRHDSTQPTLAQALQSGEARGDFAEARSLADDDGPMEDAETEAEDGVQIEDEDEILCDFEKVDNDRARGTLAVLFRDVQPDGIYHESIRASITFRPAGQARTFEIGDIALHVIDKVVCANSPQAKRWVMELVQEDATGELRDASSALQTLYDIDGYPKDAFKPFKKALKTDTIVYIDLLQLNVPWRKKGLGPLALNILHRLLRRHCEISGDYRGDITLILQPEMLNELSNTKEQRKGIQQSLVRMYKRCGYKIWHQQDARLPCYLLMGQILKKESDSDHEESSDEETEYEMMESDRWYERAVGGCSTICSNTAQERNGSENEAGGMLAGPLDRKYRFTLNYDNEDCYWLCKQPVETIASQHNSELKPVVSGNTDPTGYIAANRSSDANEPAKKITSRFLSRSRPEQAADGRLDDFDSGSTKPTPPPTSAARRLSDSPTPTVSGAGDDVTMSDPYAETEEKCFSMSGAVNNTRLHGRLRVEFGNIEFTGKLYYESFCAKILFTPEGEAGEEQVGRLFLHIVDKTYRRPSHTEHLWADELLLEQAEGDSASLSMALRCLYDQHGAIWPELVKKHKHALSPSTIVYIEELRLEEQWEKKGLGHVAMQILDQMLPRHCGNESNIVMLLQPDLLQEPRNIEGKSTSEQEMLRMETQKYSMGFYETNEYKMVHREGRLPCYILMAKVLGVGKDVKSVGDDDQSMSDNEASASDGEDKMETD